MPFDRPGIGQRRPGSKRSSSNSSRNSDTAIPSSTQHGRGLMGGQHGGGGHNIPPLTRIRSSSAQSTTRRSHRAKNNNNNNAGTGTADNGEYHYYSRYPPPKASPSQQLQQQPFSVGTSNLVNTDRRHHSHGSIPVVQPKGDSSDGGSVRSSPSQDRIRRRRRSRDQQQQLQQHHTTTESVDSGIGINDNNRRHGRSFQMERREPPLSTRSSWSKKNNSRGKMTTTTTTPQQQQQQQNSPYSSKTTTTTMMNSKSSKHHQQQQQQPLASTLSPLLISPQQPQQPPKKQQLKALRKVIDALKKAADPSFPADGRVIAITNACAEFDHNDVQRHNDELQHGAASALCTVLASLTTSPAATTTTTTTASPSSGEQQDDEIRMISSALEMVFRGQPEYVNTAFEKCGLQLLPLVLRLLERAENGDMKHADVTILNLTKVVLYLSRVSELRGPLARQPTLLDALTRVSTSTLPADARVARIRIIANLINADDDNKTALMEHEGLLDSVLRIAHLDLNDQAREYAGAALMDLASVPSNQVPLARNERLLGTLVKMALVEKIAGTRECAITAIQNLAFTKENRSRLVSFKQGIVLEALKKALSGDKNDKSRRRAAGALTNLACDETAETMGSHKGLLDTLAIVSTKDESTEVQIRAAMALTKLAASVNIRMACYPTLLDALVVASLSTSSNSVAAVLRVKARDPENRISMAQHPGILDTLADICLHTPSNSIGASTDTRSGAGINNKNYNNNSTNSKSIIEHLKDKENAMRAIMHLTNETKNRKIMCTNAILTALVDGASIPDSAITGSNKNGVGNTNNNINQGQSSSSSLLEEIRNSAIIAIERLATEYTNRPTMARHEGLIVAIALATEREAKLEKAMGQQQTTTMMMMMTPPSSSMTTQMMVVNPGGGLTTPTQSSGVDGKNSTISTNYKTPAKVGGEGGITAGTTTTNPMTPAQAQQQQQQQQHHHSFLAKPLLMSLLVAM